MEVARSQTRSTSPSRPPEAAARPALTTKSSEGAAAHARMPSRCARHACTTRACSRHVRAQKRASPPVPDKPSLFSRDTLSCQWPRLKLDVIALFVGQERRRSLVYKVLSTSQAKWVQG